MYERPPVPRHWHITRDIKPRGQCRACDLYWEQADAAEAAAKGRRE